MTEEIGRGAEAVLYKEGPVVKKDRISKGYRLPAIDERLRAFRTRREAKILSRLEELKFPAPKLLKFCDKQMHINMEFIEGMKIRDVLEQKPEEFSKEIGRKIGLLHANGIIHADLTTSNMILANEIKFIDFGLSFFSNKIEDKAVDLHLLDRAIDSAHSALYDKCVPAIIEGYKETNPEHEKVLKQLEKVRLRGRNKQK